MGTSTAGLDDVSIPRHLERARKDTAPLRKTPWNGLAGGRIEFVQINEVKLGGTIEETVNQVGTWNPSA